MGNYSLWCNDHTFQGRQNEIIEFHRFNASAVRPCIHSDR